MPSATFECEVKLRYTHDTIKAAVTPLTKCSATVSLYEPYSGVSPGQACVLYDKTRVLGGGWITGDSR